MSQLVHISGYLGADPENVNVKGDPIGISVGVTMSFEPPETRWVDILVFDDDQKDRVSRLRKGDAITATGLIESKPGSKGDKVFYRMKPLYRIGKVEYFKKSEKSETPSERAEPLGW